MSTERLFALIEATGIRCKDIDCMNVSSETADFYINLHANPKYNRNFDDLSQEEKADYICTTITANHYTLTQFAIATSNKLREMTEKYNKINN